MAFLQNASGVALHSITSPRRLLVGAMIMVAGPVIALSTMI